MATFDPPANLTDFDRSTNPATLRAHWHGDMLQRMTDNAGATPAFFNSLAPPAGTAPLEVAPEWTGLPRTIKRLKPGSIAAAAALVESSVAMGDPDPMFGRFTPSFLRDDNDQPFPGPRYRPQDEYLEWVTRKDADGVVSEVLFTCEGPEYWDAIAADKALLLTLYREIVGDNTIKLDELLFATTVSWRNPNVRGGPQRFQAGDYNPYNARNIQGAVHLTQPANTLGAEVALARAATLLYGNPTAITKDPDLVCCAGYGDVNRMSDPTIGSGVNSLIQHGRRVSLRNPIGLYMKDIQLNKISLSNGQPLPAGAQFFEPIRPQGGGEMIVRARFRVPDGVKVDGKQVRVGDLKIGGEKIVAGGQLADLVNMRLFAAHIPGAPVQQRTKCKGRPCADKNKPEFIHVITFNSTCPPGGVSTAAAPFAAVAAAPVVAAAEAEAPNTNPLLHLAKKFAVNRTPR